MDMKKLEDLFSGVAVVIDDEIDDPQANINGIIKQIESAKIPMLKYPSLPEDFVSHFQSLSFLLLDWRLSEIEKGVKMPPELQKDEDDKNIQFIKELHKNCFCPVFIFTNEDPSYLEDKLSEKNLIVKGRPSNIFIKSKSDLQGKGAFFKVVSEWLKETPSIYVLKEWEKNYQSCKTKLFSDMHSLNPSWPTIMWKCFGEDGANKSLEMGELISRNLHSRMTPFEFENDILEKKISVPPSKDELKTVLEGERFLKKESLRDDDIGTGDLFKDEDSDNGKTEIRYYLNIRAQCDLLRSDVEELELYCLEGIIVDEPKINKKGGQSFNKKLECFVEKINHAVVPFLDGGKIIEFLFYDLKIKKWNDLKNDRVGRLLPPYITRIQQRYSLYMQRQGLPRIPEDAIFVKENEQ